MKNDSQTVYLDHAAATPLLPEVMRAMEPYWQDYFGNSQAVHQAGREAREVIEVARKRIAHTLEVQPSELVFASGATEANTLALLGTARAYQEDTGKIPTICISAISHPSVLNIEKSHSELIKTRILAVDDAGEIDLSAIKSAGLPEDAVVLSVEHGNSEIGTLQPVHDLVKFTAASKYPFLHVDASQTGLYHDIRPNRLGVDLLTINAHKLGGPKGVGLLWVKSGTPLAPVFIAGSSRQVGDYQRLRPGTPPTPLIIGMAEAIALSQENYQEKKQQVKDLQDYCINLLEDQFPDMRLNGSREKRTPHNVNITFPEIDHDFLAAKLSSRGVFVSTTSACQSEGGISTVLSRLSDKDPRGLRISFSSETGRSDIDKLISELKQLV